MKEIWKDIKNYEGLYQVSNFGEIKSLERKVKNRNGYVMKKGKILKPSIVANGYLMVNLSKENKRKHFYVHKIVADTFINNENKLSVINHINGNKTNNRVDNLERCTYSHNLKEAFRIGLKKPTSKKVYQYELNGDLIKEWESVKKAEYTLKIKHISACCLGKRKTCGGYKWSYERKMFKYE